MDKIDDGGAAHPHYTGNPDHTHSGMSLRDWFAGQALVGVIDLCRHDTRLGEETMQELFARKSYIIADAMIAARKACAA